MQDAIRTSTGWPKVSLIQLYNTMRELRVYSYSTKDRYNEAEVAGMLPANDAPTGQAQREKYVRTYVRTPVVKVD